MLTLIILSILIVISLWGAVFYAKIEVNREKQRIIGTLKLYFESQDGQPSEFGKFVDTAAQMLATRVVASFKASAMGEASVLAKNEAKIEGAITQDMFNSEHPMMGMLLSQLPGLRKILQKQPHLAEMAARALASKIPSIGGFPGGNTGGDNPYKL
jgi:hypothetical protein